MTSKKNSVLNNQNAMMKLKQNRKTKLLLLFLLQLKPQQQVPLLQQEPLQQQQQFLQQLEFLLPLLLQL
jgi:hypothetical protein